MRRLGSVIVAILLALSFLNIGGKTAQASFEGGSSGLTARETTVSRNGIEADSPVSEPASAVVSLVLPIQYVSQLAEPAPSYWEWDYTPYCASASSIMVMRSFGIKVAGLANTFAVGRRGNTTWDPGLDPDGVSYLMRQYGGEGKVHSYWDPGTALNELVGRLNNGSPVVVFGQSGNHALVAYGYEAYTGGGVTAIYTADPLSGFFGRISVEAWTSWSDWFGAPFTAVGGKWQGSWTFVSYRDYR